ncbi:uncharacterized protein LTR77_006635 [Saxophila tyrrhenica]|uniref:Major facilitator superfamily (MFS) profile domain-containing protein n=1 Tax=Saxophila tyrrhenica TaxID=1690608 RepID=A0AAV9P5E8_9PEZI|nr:hypothetical protein LTR77_006635 [Saxophila tyrrhenica]
MPPTEKSSIGREQPDALRTEMSKDLDKPEKSPQADSESITSALGVGDNDDASFEQQGSDLEKAITQASHTSHEPATRIVTAVDWTGPDDKGNPMLWPLWKKGYQTMAIGSLACAITSGSSLISPATLEIAEQFQVSRTVALLPLTLYLLGLALGPVIAAPISETYGRTIVYKITAPLFLLFLVGAGFTNSLAGLLICRLLAGTAGSPCLAVGAGSTADIFAPHTRALASSLFIMMPFLGPSIGPVIGGFAAQYKGWRWTQWCTIFIGVAAFALVLPLQETYKKVILTRRAKKLGVQGPPQSPEKGWAYAKKMLTITLLRPVHMLFSEPIVLFLSLYNAFCFSVLYAFFAAYPYTFESVYGFNTWQSGLTFLGVLVGVLSAVATTMVIDRQIYMKIYRRTLGEGKTLVAPEHRLYPAMAGAFGVPVGIFWFGWSAHPSVHWISPILAGIPFAWGNLSIFISSALYLIDVYGPLNGASAMAANGLARYGLGAVFPLFTFQMYERLGIDWATSLLGFIAIGFLPIPWVFFKYGPTIRSKSAYDTIKV